MQLTDAKKNELTRKLLFSRLRILNDYGFYGLLLMHMNFKLDMNCPTAYTDGHVIAFSPEFLDSLKNSEVDFILMHEILHVALKHCFRGRKLNNFLFNIACDIVVNSNILKSRSMDINSISVGGVESMHLAPNGKEGYEYTAEEVYSMFINNGKSKKKRSKGEGANSSDEENSNGNNSTDDEGDSLDDYKTVDSHDYWVIENAEREVDEWEQRLINAYDSINASNKQGSIPYGVERLINELEDSSVDWRELLRDFLSFEVNDYSFSPPDRRYNDSFFLPDFNSEEEVLDINVLVEIDTSASITKEDLTNAYSEIKGLIDDSNGRIHGYMGFYDLKAYDIFPFRDVEDILKIRPIGGGGTSVINVFKRLEEFKKKMDDKIDAIIIITDGYDTFPNEEMRKDIPVLWIINNKVITPPWGIVARINKK